MSDPKKIISSVNKAVIEAQKSEFKDGLSNLINGFHKDLKVFFPTFEGFSKERIIDYNKNQINIAKTVENSFFKDKSFSTVVALFHQIPKIFDKIEFKDNAINIKGSNKEGNLKTILDVIDGAKNMTNSTNKVGGQNFENIIKTFSEAIDNYDLVKQGRGYNSEKGFSFKGYDYRSQIISQKDTVVGDFANNLVNFSEKQYMNDKSIYENLADLEKVLAKGGVTK